MTQKVSRVVSLVVGGVLATEAVTKLMGSRIALPQAPWLSEPWVQMAAVEWELILGLWLLSGKFRGPAWILSLGTFLSFAGVGAYLVWVGQSSCGCFGTIKVSPWHALVLDSVILGLLITVRPGWREFTQASKDHWRRGLLRVVILLLGTTVVLVLLAGGAALAFGSVEAGLARLRGELLEVSSTHIDFGSCKEAEMLHSTVKLRNWTNRPIRIIGAKPGCPLTLVEKLPITIPVDSACTLHLRMQVPQGQSGTLARALILWTDFNQQQTIRLLVTCRCSSPK